MMISERIARSIASVKGFEPEQLCTNYALYVTDGIARLPPEHGVRPAWQFFFKEAAAALEALGLEDTDDEVAK